jgi:hypothetical protein
VRDTVFIKPKTTKNTVYTPDAVGAQGELALGFEFGDQTSH